MVKLSSLSFISEWETNDQSPQGKEQQSDLETDLKVTFFYIVLLLNIDGHPKSSQPQMWRDHFKDKLGAQETTYNGS